MENRTDIELVEVGPRDGIQNENTPISTRQKIELVDALSVCGFRRMEAGSFVSPRWVPQMADSADVLTGIRRAPDVRYAALVPNLKGLAAAIEAGADEIAVFASASEGFSRANVNSSVRESLNRLAAVAEHAAAHDLPVRGYVSCVLACPYDGPTDPAAVTSVALELAAFGCYEVSLGDTIGAGAPSSVARLLEAVTRQVPPSRLAGHYHDTGGMAVANIFESVKFGLRTFDTAIGGLGGCPYAPGSPGNAATETVHESLSGAGMSTGLNGAALRAASELARALAHRQAN